MNKILIFSHTDYTVSLGGLEKVVLEHARICMSRGVEFICVFPDVKRCTIMGKTIIKKTVGYSVRINNEKIGNVPVGGISELLKKINPDKIFIHSLIDFAPIDYECFKQNCYDNVYFYIHDYRTVCSNHNLLKNKRAFCGCGIRKFSKCFNCRFFYTKFFLTKCYYSLFKCNSNLKFIFPSEIAKDIWLNFYPQISKDRCFVIPHQILEDERKSCKKLNEKIRIAYVGYKSYTKGWDTFKRICEKIDFLRYEVFLLGHSNEMLENVKVVPVSFLKNGSDAMIDAIKENRIDVALLWSPWPETYSFTFFESFVGGAFVLTNPDSGNIAVMTQRYQCGKIFSEEKILLSYLNGNHIKDDLKQYQKKYIPSKLVFNDAFLNV